MKFNVRKASDYRHNEEIEINSLEDIMKFIEENGEIVLSNDEIIIYDDYLE